MNHLSPQLLSIVAGVFLPLIAGLVTRSSASPAQRAITHMALAAVTSFVSAWVAAASGGAPFDVASTVAAVLGTFGSGVLAHVGWWRPTRVSAVVCRTGGFIGSAASSPMRAHVDKMAAAGRRADGSLPELADEPAVSAEEI